jgi:transposase
VGHVRRVDARGVREPMGAHPCAHQEHARTLTHSTDRNDARGLAHLALTGFFKPVHVKSISPHALRSLIIARKKTGGQRATLETQIRGLAAVLENTIRQFPSPAVRKQRPFVVNSPNGSIRP